MFRVFIIALCYIALSACRVEVIVPDNGYVSVVGSSEVCGAGRTCTFSVVDTYFDETFQAVPDIGYSFKGWKKRYRGLCGGKDTVCQLRTFGFEKHEALMAFLKTDETFYLEAVFEEFPADLVAPAHLGLWGGEYSDIFMGCLTCGSYDSNSVCDRFGEYGNRFSSISIWHENRYFGSSNSFNNSPWDKYATTPPAIYDINGGFYGYLTANKSLTNRVSNETLEQLVDYASSEKHDLDEVRDWFCD